MDEQEAEVEPIVVTTTHRDKGIGRALLNRMVEEANVVSFIPTRLTRRPWSVRLGRLMPGLGEVLIVKARKRPLLRESR